MRPADTGTQAGWLERLGCKQARLRAGETTGACEASTTQQPASLTACMTTRLAAARAAELTPRSSAAATRLLPSCQCGTAMPPALGALPLGPLLWACHSTEYSRSAPAGALASRAAPAAGAGTARASSSARCMLEAGALSAPPPVQRMALLADWSWGLMCSQAATAQPQSGLPAGRKQQRQGEDVSPPGSAHRVLAGRPPCQALQPTRLPCWAAAGPPRPPARG